jgi:hypothetical protein
MALKAKQLHAIEVFAGGQFGTKTSPKPTISGVAETVGVRRETLHRWLKLPEFTEALEKAKLEWFDEWKLQTKDLYFAHRRGRLEELHRLYDVIPDTYISSIAHDGTQIERTNTVVQVQAGERGTAMSSDRMPHLAVQNGTEPERV